VLTAVFGVYAAGVLAALLVFGRLSDQVGRKRVLVGAVAVAAVSTIAFLLANGVVTLLVARLLSGLAAGLTMGTATAALAELEPHRDQRRAALFASAVSTGAFGLGALVAGVFAEYLSRPTHLVFFVYLACLAVATVAMLLVPETVVERHAPAFHVQRPSVPAEIRPPFLSAAAAAFAVFALVGLFIALVPSFLGKELGQRNLAVAGLVVFVLFIVATLTQLLFHGITSRQALLGGFPWLALGLGLLVLGLRLGQLAVFVAGTVSAGAGVGLVMMGALATVNRIAPPEHRGEIVSAFFVVCYVGLAVPALGVGIASQHVGFFSATLVCSVLLALVLGGAARTVTLRP
jgi:MFS family permease